MFGQTLDLTSLAASYGITGSSTYTKALFSSNAFSWVDLYGQFLFSEPSSSVNYQENATGNLYLPSQIVFYQSEQYLVSAAAKIPHTTASLGAEIRPLEAHPDNGIVAHRPDAQCGKFVVAADHRAGGRAAADRCSCWRRRW